MEKARLYLMVFLIGICTSSTAAPVPSTSFLDQKVRLHVEDATIFEIVQVLRDVGIPICFEESKKSAKARLNFPRKEKRFPMSFHAASIRSILDEIVTLSPDYRWEVVEGATLIFIVPVASSLAWKVEKIKLRQGTVKEILESLRPELEKHQLIFPRIVPGLGDRPPEEPQPGSVLARRVEIHGNNLSFLELMNSIVYQYYGMYWTVRAGHLEIKGISGGVFSHG